MSTATELQTIKSYCNTEPEDLKERMLHMRKDDIDAMLDSLTSHREYLCKLRDEHVLRSEFDTDTDGHCYRPSVKKTQTLVEHIDSLIAILDPPTQSA